MNIPNDTSPNQITRKQYRPRSIAGACAVLAAAIMLLCAQLAVQAQSDNFDSYSSTADLTAAGWILSSLNPALVSTSLVPVGSGKGLRIQANPFPGQAPAVGMWYRIIDYTDFYVALDIASWPGTDKNQAVVMFARMTDATTGNVVSDQNPASAQGVICNYDTSQYGENPGNRRQGQFQINLVNAGFATTTIAVSEITFEPGRPYRIIFMGVGQHYTAKAYDWNDLTTPLVTIEADDASSTFTHGACGVLGFSRQGTSGTVDITIDNYFAGAADPNTAAAPALAHPVPGTPVVDTRVPAARWKNFLSPASGISFTANTFSTNIINAAATKLRLNGLDVSAQLTLSANGTNISGSLPGAALENNKLYSAELVVTDVAGTKTSTNTFWFDTFSDSYLLSSTVKIIEAEEYNYSGGSFQLDPIPVSGLDSGGVLVNGFGVGYYELLGTGGIDFSNRNSGPDLNFAAFRSQDAVRTLNGGLIGIQDAIHLAASDPGTDNVRSRHASSNLLEYVVCRTEPTEWLNYTRSFSPASYTAYLRYSSFGATTNELHRVTSDPTQPDQTTVKLGTFVIGNNIRYLNYLYTPLVNDAGSPAIFDLSGTNTLRLAIGGAAGEDVRKAMQNYIMLVQVVPITVQSSATVEGAYTQETSAVVNATTRTITLPASGSTRFYRLSSTAPTTITSISVSGGTVTLKY